MLKTSYPQITVLRNHYLPHALSFESKHTMIESGIVISGHDVCAYEECSLFLAGAPFTHRLLPADSAARKTGCFSPAAAELINAGAVPSVRFFERRESPDRPALEKPVGRVTCCLVHPFSDLGTSQVHPFISQLHVNQATFPMHKNSRGGACMQENIVDTTALVRSIARSSCVRGTCQSAQSREDLVCPHELRTQTQRKPSAS